MMNLKKRRYLGMVLGMVLGILFFVVGAIYYCPHKETYTKIVKEANCFELGQMDTICKRCDSIIKSDTLEKTVHVFCDYELIINPSASEPGIEVRFCSLCLKEEKREYYCSHKVTYNKVIKESTCCELGQINTICKLCEVVLENNTLEKTAHTFGNYELIVNPSGSEPGIEVRFCNNCSKEEKREYYCSHKVTYNKVIKEATCCEFGQINTICELCEVALENNTLEKTAHTFGNYEPVVKPSASKPGIEIRTCSRCLKQEKREYFCKHQVDSEEGWTYIKYATPFEKGERYAYCSLCGTILSETYEIPELENNSIYITGTDIKHGFTISSFTQNAVDRYDIVYTEDSYLGSKDPFVLGHNYGTLCMLDQTKVGEHIYLYINGVIEIYEVIVSEYGIQNSSKTDIIGQTTGTSIWHQYEAKTLHIYTCYGFNPNGRWIVLGKKIF